MNEQLIVKNFGPIKDATVDFKRVTVFIGPTGGGKSTLAKLAAVFRDNEFMNSLAKERELFFKDFSIDKYFKKGSNIIWGDKVISFSMGKEYGKDSSNAPLPELQPINTEFLTRLSSTPDFMKLVNDYKSARNSAIHNETSQTTADKLARMFMKFFTVNRLQKNIYIPTDRIFVPAVEYSWAGLLRDDIGLPKILLNFANDFSVAKAQVKKLAIGFLNIDYVHRNGQDFIKMPGSAILLRLYETASGIQSVTPLLVLLEYVSRNTEQAQSFIVEEPELNLYPTAQQGLLNWLVEKCTKGENDLTITTHSPYILSHLNLLLYAHHVGNKDEEKRQKVAAIIPEKYWVNPDEFAAYYVNGPEGAGGIRSLLDPETKLISQNELDAVSGIQADEFDQLLDINRGF
ncbi:AAA family ATPase [Hymenobacter sp. PAMC 26628]|uniref:AAA family ATPase n=1 Tax=Hymenobacter sp. PAMC 26628 TaxID=1484118 RepID=UPI0009020661|nr:AAA family ATPase [Hymenobacter sp. PAMC 26628]